MSKKTFEPGELHPGDFILFGGKGFVSRGIKMFTDSKWSHVAIFVGGGNIIEATAVGVEVNALVPLIKASKRIAVVRIPNLTVEQVERMKAGAYAAVSVGIEYDFLQLLTMIPYLTLRRLGVPSKWISWMIGDKTGAVVCSAFVANIAATIPFKFARSIKSVTPETIYACKNVIIVYED